MALYSDCDHQTLLPDNATEFELHLEEVLHNKYCKIDNSIIAKLHDPEKCPVEFLPWLAYAERVSNWDDSLPEQQKRQQIISARAVNKLKGTDKGLQDALDALGVKIEIIHWHQMTPPGQRGTMDLKIKVSENFNPDGAKMIDQRMVDLIEQTVKIHKRFSIHHVISLGVSFVMDLKLAFTAQFRAQMTLGALE